MSNIRGAPMVATIPAIDFRIDGETTEPRYSKELRNKDVCLPATMLEAGKRKERKMLRLIVDMMLRKNVVMRQMTIAQDPGRTQLLMIRMRIKIFE